MYLPKYEDFVQMESFLAHALVISHRVIALLAVCDGRARTKPRDLYCTMAQSIPLGFAVGGARAAMREITNG